MCSDAACAVGSQVVWAASPKTEFAVVTGKDVLCYMVADTLKVPNLMDCAAGWRYPAHDGAPVGGSICSLR